MMTHPMQQLVVGALLHDIGHLVCGAQAGHAAHEQTGMQLIQKWIQDEQVLRCISHHHNQPGHANALAADDLAHLVRAANTLAGGSPSAPSPAGSYGMLSSVFNLLNGRNEKAVFAPVPLRRAPAMPCDHTVDIKTSYGQVLQGFSQAMERLQDKTDVNALLQILEVFTSYIPSSAQAGPAADLSLAEHSRLTAAFSCCLLHWCRQQDIHDYASFVSDAAFRKQEIFQLVSVDTSGIQRFIYNVVQKGALKALRARSFYLELLLENAMDTLLAACELPRVNLLYTGGGHAYLLVPNTAAAMPAIQSTMAHMNAQLLAQYGTDLFMAYGITPCSGAALAGTEDNPAAYTNVFRSVSAQVSAMKLRRYDADTLRQLNQPSPAAADRECAACGSLAVVADREGGRLCRVCSSFEKISSALTMQDSCFVITARQEQPDDPPMLSLSGACHGLRVMHTAQAREKLRTDPASVVRIYRKNTLDTDDLPAIRLWMGDLTARNPQDDIMQFSELAAASSGIERIGVLRADVDNLGQAFIQGFMRPGEEKPGRWLSLARTMSLSRALSLFFKFHLNAVLSDPVYTLPDGKRTGQVTIIYSGGDDLLLVGPWQEVLCAGMDVRQAFRRLTGGALTLSAGIGLFDEKYPLVHMARETGRLEDAAKASTPPNGEKDAVSLFGMEAVESGGAQLLVNQHTYSWQELEQQVLGEKYTLLADTLAARPQELGQSFVYALLDLLRRADEEKLNIARLAYLLARRECAASAPQDIQQAYNTFKQRVYEWALSPRNRGQLITALMIYIYTHRTKEES